MADVSQKKGFQYALLSLLGICVIGLSVAQVVSPANTVSKAPKMVLPLPKSKEIAKAGIDALSGRQDYAGRLSVSELHARFIEMGYELDPVLSGEYGVPRLFVRSLPYDLAMIKQADERKSLFFRTLLPLVLKINEDILKSRAKVWRLRHRLNLGLALRAEDQVWLEAAFSRYRVKKGQFDQLLDKMDVVPASLVLAQAAEESGWGTSRFAREGNALFGQWTFNPKDKGIVPEGREEGKTHRIKSFDDLSGSLKAYIRNLNTHKAYAQLRKMRASMRKQSKDFSGYRLATALGKYSERGAEYIATIQSIMENNDLRRFDGLTLDDASTKGALDAPLI